jgi:zinc/manganese transport system substrate-binding protein
LENGPSADRKLVTNHDALGYFAARYNFEIIGTVIPSVSTNAEASASGLERLADLIGTQNIPAIFAETTESGRVAQALAQELDTDIAVIELHTGSLGEPGTGADTYIGMMTTNAERIAEALG